MAKPKLNLASFTGVMSAAAGKTTAPDAEIDIELIDVERQVRTDLGDLAPLAASIADIGVLEPIILLDLGNGRFRLIAGERRFRASLLAGLTKIPAVIKRGLSELQIRQIQVIENNEREDLSPYDEAMGVSEDVDKFGFKEAQAIWNRSEGWVSKRMAVKNYAEPVCDLLKSKLCGDLEVLHSLNQLHAESVDDFKHMARRLKDGVPLSRDEARNKVAAVKAFKRQEAEFAKKRAEVKAGKTPAAVKPEAKAKAEKIPKWLEEQRKKDAEKQKGGTSSPDVETAPTTSQPYLPDLTPSVAEVEAAERKRLERGLESLRNEIFEWGDANMGQFNSMKRKLAELECDMNETEFVLWSGFLSMVLPMMDALGNERALSFVKRLQTEFKTKTPILMWREQHMLASGADPEDELAERVKIPAMPADWRF